MRSSVGYRIFGQVINKVGKIADFGLKEPKGLGSGHHNPTQCFWEYALGNPGGRRLPDGALGSKTLPFGDFEFVIFREEGTERTIKLDTWRKITQKSSTVIADSRSQLDEIKSTDPFTTSEIQEQLEEIQVKKKWLNQLRLIKFL